MNDETPPTMTETLLGFLGFCIITSIITGVPLLIVYLLK